MDCIYDSFSSSIYYPSLIRLEQNLVVASFKLMKLLPAKYIVENAIARNELDPNCPIVETSSGTFAYGLGIVCAEKGIPFFIVSDAAIDKRLETQLRDLGGEVQIVGSNEGTEANIQVLRLETLKKHLAENPKGFWTNQYNNLENQKSYASFAKQLLNTLKKDIVLVGSVGSGGSTCGTIKALREVDPTIKLVGVDTFGSILFGLPSGKRVLRGLGNSLMPKNLEHYCFDEVHWVCAADAYYHTRRLHQQYGLFCGPTSGAAYQVAQSLKESNKTIVFTAPDEGTRYQDTVYNDAWLKQRGYLDAAKARKPFHATALSEVSEPWSKLEWGRRSYEEVVELEYADAVVTMS